MSKRWRIVRLVVILVLLAATAYNGLVEGIQGTHFASTTGMRVAVATQLAFGVLGLAALITVFLRPRWVFPLLVPWALAATATAALAPVVYAAASPGIGAATGAAAALVTGLAVWAWRRHVVH